MLSDETKRTIQTAYSQFLQERGLQARLGQKQMIADIARVLGNIDLDDEGVRRGTNHVGVMEAGTGTGKTVGYFLPAIPVAKAMQKQLVVATATVALQEQIVYKDLPDIRTASGLDFSFALAKGRGRYVCLAKLDRQLAEVDGPQPLALSLGDSNPNNNVSSNNGASTDEQVLPVYQSMLDALGRGEWDGDRDNWASSLRDDQWGPVTTNHRQCTGRRCSFVSQCSFFKSRDQLSGVDCIVTNHDLVLADLALGGGAILPAPEDAIYIFDEGHHLADKALNHFSHYSRIDATQRWLEECQQGVAALLKAIGEEDSLARRLQSLPDALGQSRQQLSHIYPILADCLGLGDVDQAVPRYRFAHGIVPATITEAAAELSQVFGRLVDNLTDLLDKLASAIEDRLSPVPVADLESAYQVVGTWLARAEANLALWMSYAANDIAEVPDARWLERVENANAEDLAIASSPILAAHTLDDLLWSRCCGAIVTSATLTALGNFDRLKLRAGTPEDALYRVVPSPFRYEQALLQIPDCAWDGGDAANHTQALIENLPELLDPTEGSLVLFSSRRQMREVYDALPVVWQERILLQDDRPKQQTLQVHRQRIDEAQGSVIFGLASFAEGVDLPGAYCQHVVVAKIPFSVPNDPIEEALAEWVKDRGGNPFMEISVPDASLRLIQACGRLIRSETDTGRVTIMDNRLVKRPYGRAILASLPPFRREVSSR